jgi:hypothetical protein
MKPTTFLLLFLGAGFFLACQVGSQPENISVAVPVMTHADSVKRGEYLSYTMGCHDCHTPKVMTAQGPMLDTTRLLSGHPAGSPLPQMPDPAYTAPGQWALMAQDLTAAVGPWGTSFTANLTPDETGIGNWTFDNFKTALRKGLFKGIEGSRPIMPPMPWQTIGMASDEDLANLWVYLNSLKPIKNMVPDYIPPAGAPPQG